MPEPVAGACPWCGSDAHTQLQCGRLKGVEFDPATREIVKVWFLTPADLSGAPDKVGMKYDEPQGDYLRLKPIGR